MEVNEETFEADYDKYITGVVIRPDGNEVGDAVAFDLDIVKESKKADDERLLPIFIYENGGTKNYIIPMQGSGLWGPINAYLALSEDLNTIAGIVFDHQGETPGLGAEITKDFFQDQFKGKKLYDSNNVVAIDVLKGTGNDIDGKPHAVDGIAGATITADGVEDMFKDELANYSAYLQN